MPRPKASADPDSLFTKGVIHGLGLARAALTDLHRKTPAERTGVGLSRAAIELTIATERAERGMEPEALELLARIEAMRNGNAAPATVPPSAPRAKPGPKPAEKPQPAPELAAAFMPIDNAPRAVTDPHEADTEAPDAPEPGAENESDEPDAAEEWANEP